LHLMRTRVQKSSLYLKRSFTELVEQGEYTCSSGRKTWRVDVSNSKVPRELNNKVNELDKN